MSNTYKSKYYMSEVESILDSVKSKADKEYVDEQIAEAETTAKNYTDTKASAAEGNAKEYADGKAGAALTSAKEYADTKADGAESAAKQYADTKAETAEGNAKEYADSKAQVAETAAKSYADEKLAEKADMEDDYGGGVIGRGAQSHDGGGTVGLNAQSTYGGGAVGRNATANEGSAAVGDRASANFGAAAVGCGAVAVNGGGAVGYSAEAGEGFSGGKSAKAGKTSTGQYKDAIQLGTGTNNNEKTLQVYSHQLMDADGKIPLGRLRAISADCIADGAVTTSKIADKAVTSEKISDGVIPTKTSDLENDEEYLKSADAVGKKGTGEGAEIFNDYTNNQATGQFSHAEGMRTTASGNRAHAEGGNTIAIGISSHAEGQETQAIGITSHAEGRGTIASGQNSHVEGKHNIEDTEDKYIHIAGNGDFDPLDGKIIRSNAHTIDWNGVGWFKGGLKIGGNGQDDENAKDIATIEQVTAKASNAETAAKNYTDTKLNGKADRYAISASVTGNTLLLADKSDTQLLSAAAAALTLTLPETVTSGYECFFSFKSGATATILTVPSGITWAGADCNASKQLVPMPNTVYEVGIRRIGTDSNGDAVICARVGAC